MSEYGEGKRLVLPVGERDHVLGPADAAVTLVEYGDYECPYCGRAHPIVQEVQRKLGAELRFVFRNFPLKEMHPHAERAAEAAEAVATAKGDFWEMHDLLFENQGALDAHHLMSYAEESGVDKAAFERTISNPEIAERVREDFMSGVRSGVNGTPTFFINGRRHDGSWELADLLSAIENSK